MQMSKKLVVITGGTKGIGKEIAKKFLENKWFVLVGSRKASIKMNKLNKNINYFKIDVRFEKDHIKLLEYAKNWVGSINCYINCAGYSKWSPIKNVNEKIWNDMIDTNLKGTFWGCKAASKYLKKGSSIINISSIAGKRGSINNSVYCASKFGVNGITQSLSKELGPKGIRINSVCPVYVETNGLVSALNTKFSPSKNINYKKYLNKFKNENASLKRLPTHQEVADLCYYLSSNESSAITGQNINIDCGVFPQ